MPGFRQVMHVKHIRMIIQCDRVTVSPFQGAARDRSAWSERGTVKQKAHLPRSFWFYNLYRVLAYRKLERSGANTEDAHCRHECLRN
jgi:hypothetical protein